MCLQIQDSAAIAFTRAFYVAFLSGRTVRDSFDIAKEALKVAPCVFASHLEGNKFILLPDGLELPSHDKALFNNRTVETWSKTGHCTTGPNHTDLSVATQRNKIPAPPADFEGREVIMHSLISSIIERRLVSLVGEEGVGKTSVASAVCKYITDRKIFPDSVVFMRAMGLKDYKNFLKGVVSTLLTSGKDTNRRDSSNLIYPEEELIFQTLESSKMLLVIDGPCPSSQFFVEPLQ